MAPTDNRSNEIVREWYDPNAGTAEGRKVQTRDGRIWSELPQNYTTSSEQVTGVTRGEKRGNRIY